MPAINNYSIPGVLLRIKAVGTNHVNKPMKSVTVYLFQYNPEMKFYDIVILTKKIIKFINLCCILTNKVVIYT